MNPREGMKRILKCNNCTISSVELRKEYLRNKFIKSTECTSHVSTSNMQ